MNEIPHLLLVVVGTYLVHSTLLLGGLWALLRLNPGLHPRLSESLWKLAALAPLVTIPVQLLAGTSAFCFGVASHHASLPIGDGGAAEQHVAVPHEAGHVADHDDTIGRREVTEASLRPPAGSDVDEGPDGPVRARSVDPSPSERNADRLVATESPDRTGTRDRAQDNARRPRKAWAWAWTPWITLCALSIGALGVFRFALVSHRFHHWLLRCEDYQGPARQLLDELLDRARLRRGRVRLLRSEREREPAALGVHRWRIILPSGIDRWLSREDLTAVLAHELAHLVRRDPVWQNVGRLLCGCAAFQPLNFIAWRNWCRAAEVQCDAWAVQHGADRLALARGLTLMAERRNQGQLTGVLQPAVGSTGNLSERVERLLERRPLETCPRWSESKPLRLLMWSSLLAACCFLLPGIRVAAVTPPAAADEHAASAARTSHAARQDEDLQRGGSQVLMQQLAALDKELDSLGAEIRALQRNPRVGDRRSPAWRKTARLTSLWQNLKERRNALSQLASQLEHNWRKP